MLLLRRAPADTGQNTDQLPASTSGQTGQPSTGGQALSEGAPPAPLPGADALPVGGGPPPLAGDSLSWTLALSVAGALLVAGGMLTMRMGTRR